MGLSPELPEPEQKKIQEFIEKSFTNTKDIGRLTSKLLSPTEAYPSSHPLSSDLSQKLIYLYDSNFNH